MDNQQNDLGFFGFDTKSPKKIDYTKLNPEQYDAVTHTEGPQLIIAGAGSGKTTTLTYRLAHIIDKGVDPRRILLLTFTNKAANEMVQRAMKLLGWDENALNPGAPRVNGSTYHSFCNKLISNYKSQLGFGDFVIKTPGEMAMTIDYVKALKEIGVNRDDDDSQDNNNLEPFPTSTMLVKVFSAAVNRGKSLEWAMLKFGIPQAHFDDIKLLKKALDDFKEERNIVDYDDLLILAIKLLKENPEIRRRVQETFLYIMVDEYQDSNVLQFELIKLMRDGYNKNICVVGDDQQCIVEGSHILTTNGEIPIETLTMNDRLIVGSGQGWIHEASPQDIMVKPFKGTVYDIRTKFGRKLSVTGEHTMFASWKGYHPNQMDTADLYLFGGDIDDISHCYTHKIWISNEELVDELNSLDHNDDMGTVLDFLDEKLKEEEYSYLTHSRVARMCKGQYHAFVQAKNLMAGMFIPVFYDGKIVNDTIVTITPREYEGNVYDINVDFFMNYIVSGICVHNCIYGFRGANRQNIMTFPNEFHDTKLTILDRNYRSTQEILDFTNAVAEESKERYEKTLKGVQHGNKPLIIESTDENGMFSAIYRDIVNRLQKGYKLSDMAVLIRMGRDSYGLEAMIMNNMSMYNIPYKKVGGPKFIEKECVQDVFSMLKVIVNYKDEIAQYRALRLLYGVGEVYAKRTIQEIIGSGMDYLADEKLTKKKYAQCFPMYLDWYKQIENAGFEEQLQITINSYYDIRKYAIENMNKKSENKRKELFDLDRDRVDLHILETMASGFSKVSDFINSMTLDQIDLDSNEDGDYLLISTIHSAKGLEFDTTYIPYCIDKHFPYSRTHVTDEIKEIMMERAADPQVIQDIIEDMEEEEEEERRVFYVAITRAKKNLFMFCPRITFAYGKPEASEVSPYIKNNISFCNRTFV